MATYEGATVKEAIIKATMAVCRPCCRGAGSGSVVTGIPVPCGCAGCACCPDACWWATEWHKAWTADSPKYATGEPTPAYTMTDYSMTLVSNPDGYYYLGDVGGDEDTCDIGGVVPVGEDCAPGDPLHILTGTIDWTETAAPFTVYTFQIDYYLDIRILWNCDEVFVSSTYSGLYVNGLQYGPGGDPDFDAIALSSDFFIALNSNVDELTDPSTCGFTTTALSSLPIPEITIIPIA